jgi:hypothetical protein
VQLLCAGSFWRQRAAVFAAGLWLVFLYCFWRMGRYLPSLANTEMWNVLQLGESLVLQLGGSIVLQLGKSLVLQLGESLVL